MWVKSGRTDFFLPKQANQKKRNDVMRSGLTGGLKGGLKGGEAESEEDILSECMILKKKNAKSNVLASPHRLFKKVRLVSSKNMTRTACITSHAAAVRILGINPVIPKDKNRKI